MMALVLLVGAAVLLVAGVGARNRSLLGLALGALALARLRDSNLPQHED